MAPDVVGAGAEPRGGDGGGQSPDVEHFLPAPDRVWAADRDGDGFVEADYRQASDWYELHGGSLLVGRMELSSAELRRRRGVAFAFKAEAELLLRCGITPELLPWRRRGAVSSKLSKKSRRSMSIEFMSYSAAWEEWNAHVVVLTYGDDFPGVRESKDGHLEVLFTRLNDEFGRCEKHSGADVRTVRKCGGCKAMRPLVHWKIERQLRGAVHYQMAVSYRQAVGEVEAGDWFRANWLDITGCGGSTVGSREAHGVRVRSIWDVGGAAGYLVKEISGGKSYQDNFGAESPGRWWGMRNREHWENERHEPESSAAFGAMAFDLPKSVIEGRIYRVNRKIRGDLLTAVRSDKTGRHWVFDATWHVGAAVRYILAPDDLVSAQWEHFCSIVEKNKRPKEVWRHLVEKELEKLRAREAVDA